MCFTSWCNLQTSKIPDCFLKGPTRQYKVESIYPLSDIDKETDLDVIYISKNMRHLSKTLMKTHDPAFLLRQHQKSLLFFCLRDHIALSVAFLSHLFTSKQKTLSDPQRRQMSQKLICFAIENTL